MHIDTGKEQSFIIYYIFVKLVCYEKEKFSFKRSPLILELDNGTQHEARLRVNFG
jgi:hypothetical protein